MSSKRLLQTVARRKLLLLSFGVVCAPVAAHAQVPDLVNAFDSGGRALGMGSSNNVTGSETQSAYSNPAGLGYMTRAEIGVSVRNIPRNVSAVSGDISGAHSLSTTSTVGATAWSHVGIAMPLKGRNGGTNGTFAVTYSTGGVDRDERVADVNLAQNGSWVPSYHQSLSLQNNFLSFAYGRSNGSQTFNWGVALLYAINHQSNLLTGTATNTSFDAAAHGWGGLIGVQSAVSHDVTFGLSYRTAIDLKSESDTPLLYNKIPARLTAGLAWRKEMGGEDFFVASAEANHYFEGSRGQFFDSPAQTTYGLGLEYDFSTPFGQIPLRLGYNVIPSDGEDFGSRNTYTFGLGYRPASSNWGVDVNFAKPANGGTDFGLNFLYRFGH
jgi:hypothetical protein